MEEREMYYEVFWCQMVIAKFWLYNDALIFKNAIEAKGHTYEIRAIEDD